MLALVVFNSSICWLSIQWDVVDRCYFVDLLLFQAKIKVTICHVKDSITQVNAIILQVSDSRDRNK